MTAIEIIIIIVLSIIVGIPLGILIARISEKKYRKKIENNALKKLMEQKDKEFTFGDTKFIPKKFIQDGKEISFVKDIKGEIRENKQKIKEDEKQIKKDLKESGKKTSGKKKKGFFKRRSKK